MCNAEDNGMKVEGSYNIIEQCVFHDNNDTGLQIGMTMALTAIPGFPAGLPYANPDYQFCRGNIVINCDSYNNANLRMYNGAKDDGGNADGKFCMVDGNDYIKEANEQRFTVVQIEDPEPLSELEEICALLEENEKEVYDIALSVIKNFGASAEFMNKLLTNN